MHLLLRRCGWSAVEVYPPSSPNGAPSWGWAAFGPLPGHLQTVPRSELYAGWIAFRFSPPGQELSLWTDHLDFVRGVPNELS